MALSPDSWFPRSRPLFKRDSAMSWQEGRRSRAGAQGRNALFPLPQSPGELPPLCGEMKDCPCVGVLILLLFGPCKRHAHHTHHSPPDREARPWAGRCVMGVGGSPSCWCSPWAICSTPRRVPLATAWPACTPGGHVVAARRPARLLPSTPACSWVPPRRKTAVPAPPRRPPGRIPTQATVQAPLAARDSPRPVMTMPAAVGRQAAAAPATTMVRW